MASKNGKKIVEYRNYYLSPEFPVLLMSGEKWEISDIPSDHLHFHNYLEIGICHSGNGTLEFYNGQKLHFQSGDITFIPRNIPHTTYSAPSSLSKWSYIFFNPRQFFTDLFSGAEFFSFQNGVCNYLIPYGFSRRISLLIQFAIEELSAQEPDQMLAKSYLFALYSEIVRFWRRNPYSLAGESNIPSASEKQPPFSGADMLIIAPALSYIEDNYMNKFPIEQLAEICHLSPTHFRRIFQSVMRTSPLHYLNTIRIMNACNLLTNTNYTILTISEMTGFSTLSNFHRQFSRMMSLSPTEYRKQGLWGVSDDQDSSITECTGWMEIDIPGRKAAKRE